MFFFLLLFYIITYIYCLFYHSCLLIDPFLFLSCHYFKGHTCPVPICTSTKSNISNLCEVGCKNITASIRTLGMYATNYTAERITAPYAHLPRIVCVYEAHLASLSHTHTLYLIYIFYIYFDLLAVWIIRSYVTGMRRRDNSKPSKRMGPFVAWWYPNVP